jgi:23S rRNA (guanine2445-N2)-methyltransferase / 23S rRNA (guanine2069-N7)-methyltransferase
MSPRKPPRPPLPRTKDIAFFATAAKGIEPILHNELIGLGARNVRESRGGVSFEGTRETAYKACLWLRSANRVLLPIARFSATDADTLYNGVAAIQWENEVEQTGTIAVDFTGHSESITNTQFGAQRVKDGIVDRIRQETGTRPSVNLERPDVRINCNIHKEVVTVSIDLSGDSLHMRGYRRGTVTAPLKETLAAALVLKSGWPAICTSGGSFVDPMCGSGTLVIEAAMIAGHVAPGLGRDYWGFNGWRKHDRALWERTVAAARERQNTARTKTPMMVGYDMDAKAILASQQNARTAGVAPMVRFEHKAIVGNVLPSMPPGLALMNPPYGERIGGSENLSELYVQIGAWLRTQCLGWHAAMIVSDAELGKNLGMRAEKINTFYNGALECKLLQFDVQEKRFMHSV